MKCSFRLPYTTNEDGDPEEVETNESPGQAPIFNFTIQLGINEVFGFEIQQILLLVTFLHSIKLIVLKRHCAASE